MKKLAVFIGALCAVILVSIYCTTVDYNNPLDKKGKNYLEGDTTNEKAKIDESGGRGSAFFDPDHPDADKWRCDRVRPKSITVLGGQSVTIDTGENGRSELNKWMGFNG